MKNDAGWYLSKLLLILACISLILTFVILPFLLDHDGPDLKTGHLREFLWQKSMNLPVPTIHALAFSDHRVVRMVICVVLFLTGLCMEIFVHNKKMSGSFHACLLLGSMGMGYYFMLGCLLPFIPL